MASVLYMSMSLDGFIAGPNEGPGNGLGDGGHRLHEWALAGADADRRATWTCTERLRTRRLLRSSGTPERRTTRRPRA